MERPTARIILGAHLWLRLNEKSSQISDAPTSYSGDGRLINTSKLLPLALASAVLLPSATPWRLKFHKRMRSSSGPSMRLSRHRKLRQPPPVCNATVTRGETVNGLTEVILDGSGSYDPEGEDLVYCWRVACPGPGLIDEHSATTSMFVKTAPSAVAPAWRISTSSMVSTRQSASRSST